MAEIAEMSDETLGDVDDALAEGAISDASPDAGADTEAVPVDADITADAEADTDVAPTDPDTEVAPADGDEPDPDSDTEADGDEPAPDASAGATSEVDTAEGDSEDGAESEPEAAPKPLSPYDLPGDWYVIHSYSGYENKVKANLETRIRSMHMEDHIYEVHIPMEDVVEIKNGKKVTVPRKVFPGYILVRLRLDDDSWYAVRNTPGVTGFVGGNQKPTPLSRREVERFLGVQEEEEKAKPRFKPAWEVGEQVRVVTGPFADFNGVIEDINIDQQKVVVLVNIFGRDTPVELGFDDIQKN